MPRYRLLYLTLGLCLATTQQVVAQSTFAQPYSAQLKTDPSVGNVQGIQRYGRPLKTDPDQGTGYSYHVYPVAHEPRVAVAPKMLAALAKMDELKDAVNDAPLSDEDTNSLKRELSELKSLVQTAGGYSGYGPYAPPITPYAGTFDSTAGLRNFSTPLGAPEVLRDPLAIDAFAKAAAVGVDATTKLQNLIQIYHQPLIQIKLRVVEVVRNDGLQVNSVLEYVSRQDVDSSLTSGKPLNAGDGTTATGFENVRGITNFELKDLVSALNKGAGGLINLTSDHINWAVSFLASEFNGDVITAPEVVTLNGQNVEFISGEKIPFQLGQNVIAGTNNNIQQVFYKNVGTYVSVTPKIVNWGLHGEGRGEAAIVASEILDWNALIKSMLDPEILKPDDALRAKIEAYVDNDRIVPFAIKQDILLHLNKFRKSDLIVYQRDDNCEPVVITKLGGIDPNGILDCQGCQDWRPEDCTIDMALVVRLSEQGEQAINLTSGNTDAISVNTSTEKNVRAVANVIQIKSGEGVVMAGLIGEREEEVAEKIPVLGDLPYVGFLFRSKATARQKTELLIFLEATVLDRRPEVAKAQSVHDFQLGRDYVEGELLDNPLECGMYRAGFGNYLPPVRHGEEQYWKRYHRKLRKISTHIDDIKE